MSEDEDVSNFVAVHPYDKPFHEVGGGDGFFQKLRRDCRTDDTIQGVSSFGKKLITLLREQGYHDGWIGYLLGFEADRYYYNWTYVIKPEEIKFPEWARTPPHEFACELPAVGRLTIRAPDADQKEWEGFINGESVAKATKPAKIARIVEEIATDRLNKMPPT